MDERSRIAMLARTFGERPAAFLPAGIEVAIGDDAAVLDARRAPGRLVWTIDEQVDGTHFRRDLLSWRDVGWRSFMAAASDLAAMAADPWCALCALSLPDDVGDAALEEIALGQRDAALAVGAPVVGGNLSRGPVLSIATTLLGTCVRPVLRRGARPGDGVWLAGEIGVAAAGLRALEAGRAAEAALRGAVDAWRSPRALVAEGRAMSAFARAAIDVSDGLARDAGHVADAGGVRIVLDEQRISESSALRQAAAALGADAVDLALHGGEDYALLAASPAPIDGFRRIGEVREGSGLALRGSSGERSLEACGFDHFESAASSKRSIAPRTGTRSEDERS